jgi:S-adenosylmethionine synthetase
MNNNISFIKKYNDPEKGAFEIVERKGLGHPDSLADGLANAVSVSYSNYCLEKFGYVLHHNVDKLYIGGGMFLTEYKKTTMIEPIKVMVNGRFSNRFGGKKINLKKIQEKAIRDYLQMILPSLNPKKDIKIFCNSSQNIPNMNNPYWYTPRNVGDLPEQEKIYANDTSVVVACSPKTITEQLTLNLEKFFWSKTASGIKPKYKYYGQDIKVMSVRNKKSICSTLCVPIISKYIKSDKEYYSSVVKIEKKLQKFADNFLKGKGFTALIKVNPSEEGKHEKYILGLGSCIEGGEEGVVGRGNYYNGVISIFRPSSVEAPFGKNPLYHTGRVLAYILNKISARIYTETGIKNTIFGVTKNRHSLIPPSDLILYVNKKTKQKIIKNIIKEEMGKDYLPEILKTKIVY